MMEVRELLQQSKVIPVLALDDPDTAPALAQALCAGGATVLEITLRTPAAFDVLTAIKENVPDAIVGAGTVNTEKQIDRCQQLKLDFMVSPGLHPALVESAQSTGIAYLPGVATASEVLAATMQGLDTLKFFPAVAAGGSAMLKALAGPYADIVFCPTGGINTDNYREFLKLKNVACVGGSWIAPTKLIQAQQWDEITALARSACQPAHPATLSC